MSVSWHCWADNSIHSRVHRVTGSPWSFRRPPMRAWIVLGIGGSASTDGEAGLLIGPGARLRDREGEPVGRGGGALAVPERIDPAGLHRRLAVVELLVACDVDNPLCGPSGTPPCTGRRRVRRGRTSRYLTPTSPTSLISPDRLGYCWLRPGAAPWGWCRRWCRLRRVVAGRSAALLH
jgi:hypothetical protein